ncbi:MAG: RDD family protein [Alphaproteobacteria bacterium]
MLQNFNYAHPVRRLIAAGIDLFIFILVFKLVYALIGTFYFGNYNNFLLQRIMFAPIQYIFAIELTFITMWMMTTVCNVWFGGTLGKKMLDLQVVNYKGQPIGYLRAFLRALCSPTSSILYFLAILPVPINYLLFNNHKVWAVLMLPANGYYILKFFPFIMISAVSIFLISSTGSLLFSFSKQGLHDQIARTLVIRRENDNNDSLYINEDEKDNV